MLRRWRIKKISTYILHRGCRTSKEINKRWSKIGLAIGRSCLLQSMPTPLPCGITFDCGGIIIFLILFMHFVLIISWSNRDFQISERKNTLIETIKVQDLVSQHHHNIINTNRIYILFRNIDSKSNHITKQIIETHFAHPHEIIIISHQHKQDAWFSNYNISGGTQIPVISTSS